MLPFNSIGRGVLVLPGLQLLLRSLAGEQCRPTGSEALTAAVSQWWPGLLLDQERRVSDVQASESTFTVVITKQTLTPNRFVTESNCP